eukprot:g78325.t1
MRVMRRLYLDIIPIHKLVFTCVVQVEVLAAAAAPGQNLPFLPRVLPISSVHNAVLPPANYVDIQRNSTEKLSIRINGATDGRNVSSSLKLDIHRGEALVLLTPLSSYILSFPRKNVTLEPSQDVIEDTDEKRNNPKDNHVNANSTESASDDSQEESDESENPMRTQIDLKESDESTDEDSAEYISYQLSQSFQRVGQEIVGIVG